MNIYQEGQNENDNLRGNPIGTIHTSDEEEDYEDS